MLAAPITAAVRLPLSARVADEGEGEAAPAKPAGKQRKGKGKAAADAEEGGPVRLPMSVSQQLTGGRRLPACLPSGAAYAWCWLRDIARAPTKAPLLQVSHPPLHATLTQPFFPPPPAAVLRLGEVEWLHPAFHNEKFIFPPGYKAERTLREHLQSAAAELSVPRRLPALNWAGLAA